jgi:hypothetical protein
MRWNLTTKIQILVAAAMVAERLTPSDFDERAAIDLK